MLRRLLTVAGLGLALVACSDTPASNAPGTATPVGTANAAASPAATPSATIPVGPPPVLAPAAPSGSGDWPMYGHDTTRSNSNAAETDLARANVAQLAAAWQADIGGGAGPPSGAPSVADGRVFVGSSVGDGPNLFAFDASSGKPLWQADIGHGAACFGVGVGATPAISGTVLVTGGGDNAYYGLDSATGMRLWRNDLDEGQSAFPWASPLIAGGVAYFGIASGCDNPSVRGEISAVDLATGTLLARQYFVPDGQAGAGLWNSPALSADGQTLAVATGEDDSGFDGPLTRAMVSLDPLSLAIRDAVQEGGTGGDLDWATTPVIFPDGQNHTLVAANHKDNFFYVYDLANLSAGPLWSRQTGTVIGLMPAYDPRLGPGGTLFFVDGYGHLNAVDPDTGTLRWTPAPIGTPHGNIAIANGLIFANDGETGVLVLDETTGQPLTTLMPAHAGKSYSGVVVAHGTVYWLSGTYLNAWALPGT